MRGQIITGIDVGSSRVKTVIAQKISPEEPLEILGIGSVPSFGVRKGVVVNIDEVTKNIIESIGEAKGRSGQKINSVYASLGGSHIFSTLSHGIVAVSRADQKVSREDVQRVVLAAQTISLPSNKEILHTLPLNFIIDGEGGINNALGMSGVRLEMDALLLGAFSPYIKSLTQAFLNSDLGILDLVISPLAAAKTCLTARQKELGVALLDIGAGTTGLAVFTEGDLVHLSNFALGSSHITNDIAIGLRTDIDVAERIKLEYGISSAQWLAKKEIIDLSSTSGASLEFSRKEVADIIEARLSEIFGQVIKELRKMPKETLLPGGIVLTGGGVNLPKIVDFAKKELKLPCRIGFPQNFTKPIEDPSLAVACGLALWGAESDSKESSALSGGNFTSKFKNIFRNFIP